MPFNEVLVELTNGNLGQVTSINDGISGLIVSGTATSEMPLNTARVIYGLKDLQGLGITEESHPSVFRHVKEFYAEQSGQELWLMLCNPTVSLEDICDKDNAYAHKLVKDSGNRVRLLGVTRTPPEEYEATIEGGIDKDCYDALAKAHALAEHFAANESSPLRILIEAHSFTGNAGNLTDLKTMAYPRAGLVLMSSVSDGSSSVGMAMGRKATQPVQRKISRTRTGPLPLTECYVGATKVAGYSGAVMIHDKGFITARTYPKKTGYYFTSDHMATSDTDDYNSLARGCVIDKSHIIAYDVFMQEIDEEVVVDSAGRIATGIIKTLEANIENAINIAMAGEISSFDVFINPAQNVLSTNKIVVEMNIIPVGYSSSIKVLLGFKNPALASS